MGLFTVYSNNLSPSAPNLSTRFTDATSFFIHAPLIGAGIELEIDVFLQVYLPYGIGQELVRNLPLGKIEEQTVFLNITDTETLNTIPQEYLNSNLEMALLFLATDTTFLEAIIIKPQLTLTDIYQDLQLIKTQLGINT